MSFISKTPGVMGGRACIRNTRISVWILEERRRLGESDAGLLEDYPGLNQDDLDTAWVYVAANRPEIDADIQANAMEDDEPI